MFSPQPWVSSLQFCVLVEQCLPIAMQQVGGLHRDETSRLALRRFPSPPPLLCARSSVSGPQETPWKLIVDICPGMGHISLAPFDEAKFCLCAFIHILLSTHSTGCTATMEGTNWRALDLLGRKVERNQARRGWEYHDGTSDFHYLCSQRAQGIH